MKSKAIVLHKSLWKESSLLVQLMTDTLGVVSSLVQGARREKSPYFAHFEIGNTLEVILHKSPAAQLYKVIGSSIIPRMQYDTLSYTQLLSTQAVLEVYSQMQFTPEESQRFFTLLQTYLDYIPTVSSNHLLVVWRFLIRLTDELGFPIVYFDGRTYQLSDEEIFYHQYDDEFRSTIKSWLSLLPSTSNIIKEFNILDNTCKMMNQFIFDWFCTHLDKQIYCKVLKLYEERLEDNVKTAMTMSKLDCHAFVKCEIASRNKSSQ